MNNYLHEFFTYFENAVHHAAPKESLSKKKKRNSQQTYQLQASPDCFNMRSTVRKQDSIRRNPAP
jgi:hypothetical protein